MVHKKKNQKKIRRRSKEDPKKKRLKGGLRRFETETSRVNPGGSRIDTFVCHVSRCTASMYPRLSYIFILRISCHGLDVLSMRSSEWPTPPCSVVYRNCYVITREIYAYIDANIVRWSDLYWLVATDWPVWHRHYQASRRFTMCMRKGQLEATIG